MSRKTITNFFSLVVNDRPLSYNCDNKKKKAAYKNRIASAFNRKYIGMIADGELYAVVYYFYNTEEKLDADNISKPVWDSLNAVGFTDDNQIKIRSAIAININEHYILDFDQDNIAQEDIYDLINSIQNNDHTLYIQVGLIDNYTNIFNMSELWK